MIYTRLARWIAIIFLVSIILYANLLIGGCCSYSTTGGGLSIDVSPIISVAGFVLLMFGLWGIFKLIKKRKTVLIFLLSDSLLLFAFGVFVMYESKTSVGASISDFENILPPNPLSSLIFLLTAFGLFVYSIYKLKLFVYSIYK